MEVWNKLVSSTIMVAKIIYGTAWKKDKTTQLVVSAVLQGFRAIDTACQPKHYREDLVGEALQILQDRHGIKREELFIQTKYTPIGGQDISKPLPYNPADSITDQVHSSFLRSLANLHTTYLDSYILHSPLQTLDRTVEAWRVLMSLQDEGKIRLIGVSNTYDVHVLQTLGQERKVQVVQNRWYQGNQWDKDVFKYCKDHDIQYQSFWTLSGSPALLAHPTLSAIAQTANCTPAQALFRVAQLEGVTPLSGTTSETHMREDVAVEKLELSNPEDLNSIRSLLF